ncbi:MAG: response regulator [Anaerolineales bacterium]|nr:MAG: response regulator [Anaerolineales bacterium]
MVKPIILSVDDESQVLNAIERDLRAHFTEDYRILKAASGAQALEAVHELKQRGAPIALFLVDQRMPEMSGTDFLTQARLLYPDTKKVLLTAYADTDAAIQSINTIGLDHYLMKPWDPPELNLYPVLDDLLSDWWANATLPYDGIRVAGTLWSAESHHVKDFLARNRIPYQWLDIETDQQAKAMLDGMRSNEQVMLPVVFFPDGSQLIAPEFRELAQKIGLKTEAAEPFYDLIIIGAGPAGLGAAVYSASEGLHTLMIEREATGGQAGTSSRIENYLGFPKGVSGADLARRATDQAIRLGAEILTAREVERVRVEDPYRYIQLKDGAEIGCRAMVIATGVTVRELDVPGIQQFLGAGVYYGATLTEAANFSNEKVFVVGGANSAGQAAMHFSQYAGKVTMLVRGSSLGKGMSQYLVDQIEANPKIEVRTQTVVESVDGKEMLEAVSIRDLGRGTTERLEGKAMFIFIGAVPHSECVKDVVDRDDIGFIFTGMNYLDRNTRPRNWTLKRDPFLLETNVPGIFAAGDVRNGAIRRVASAVGEGAATVNFVHQYLRTV